MAGRKVVVVDGSNLATEGRTTPSLRQLDEAVRAYAEEDPEAEIVVVVDASFEHRIDPSERPELVDAELHGEVVSPPAGAIGRGDAFVLRIAERTGARVLSNDSFQEFHGEHPWLFDEGRLVGGKPVPGVGWIFTPRIPVRGPKSRQATGKAKRAALDESLSPPVKAAELARAAKKVAARKAPVMPDGRAPQVGDVWPAPGDNGKGQGQGQGKGQEAPAPPGAARVAAPDAEPGAARVTAEGEKKPKGRHAKKEPKRTKLAVDVTAANDPGSAGGTAAVGGTEATARDRAAKKAAAKTAPAKKAAAKKAAAKEAPATKEPSAKKAPVKKTAPAKKAVAAKAAVKKAPVKKAPAKKAPAKKAAGKRAAPDDAADPDGAAASDGAPADAAKGEPATKGAATRARVTQDPTLIDAIDQAIAEVLSPPPEVVEVADEESRAKRQKGDGKDAKRRRRRTATPPPAVNEPLAFITFVASYPLNSELDGEVVSFTSHGAMVDVELPGGGLLHCYIPLAAMGFPPPTKARRILTRGERRRFVLVGLDPPRRVAELALPGVPAVTS
jgi:Zc3h12a-like Ribonuclease NYN domain